MEHTDNFTYVSVNPGPCFQFTQQSHSSAPEALKILSAQPFILNGFTTLKSHWANSQYIVSKMYLVQLSVDLNCGETEESSRDTSDCTWNDCTFWKPSSKIRPKQSWNKNNSYFKPIIFFFCTDVIVATALHKIICNSPPVERPNSISIQNSWKTDFDISADIFDLCNIWKSF